MTRSFAFLPRQWAPLNLRSVGPKEIHLKLPTFRLLVASLILTRLSVAHGGESIEAQLKRVADETRKTLPMMVSDDIQATNIAAVGKILMNRYNFTKRKTALNVNTLKAEYYGNSVSAACTNPDTLTAFRNGVSVEYQYYDSSNEFVMQYTIDANTCRITK